MADRQALSPHDVQELLERQAHLQAESRAVLADLDLMTLLRSAGQPVQIGSSVVGLMVWRDIDIQVYCDPVSADLAFETVRPLASHPCITKLRYANWSGPFSIATLPDGYYWGIRYRVDGGAEWKIDVWFLPSTAGRTEETRMQHIRERLTQESLLAILWIKDVWHRLPTYRHVVTSMDIYDAVLKHGVRTPVEFEAYLARHGKQQS